MSADHRQKAEQFLAQAEKHTATAAYEQMCLAKAQIHATFAVHDELRQLVAQGVRR
jgi:hypothetical protein